MIEKEVKKGQELEADIPLAMTEEAISARRLVERGIKIIQARERMGLVVGRTTSVAEITEEKE